MTELRDGITSLHGIHAQYKMYRFVFFILQSQEQPALQVVHTRMAIILRGHWSFQVYPGHSPLARH